MMMTRIEMMHLSERHFGVYLNRRMIGRLYQCHDVTRFEFEDDYWDDPERAILGLRFEDNPNAIYRSKMRLPPWFSNLLPEGRLRDWIAHACNASPQREMELLAQVGHDLPGAVRICEIDFEQTIGMDFDLDHLPSSNIDSSSIWKFSLAGIGLKFSMLARDEHLTIPAVHESGDWILKLPDPQFKNVPLNEFAMMTLAKEIGITIPEIRLIHRDLIDPLPDNAWLSKESWAYAVKRFDRGAEREPIHIEDLAQVRGFYPDKKYQGSFETIGALIYRNRDVDALQEFARRLAFNILIGNGDAHLKNWSLIYLDPRNPTLAPAYDLVATSIYRPPKTPEDMGLKFGKSRKFELVKLSTFDQMEKTLGVKANLAEIAMNVVNLVNQKWPIAESILSAESSIAFSINNFIRDRTNQLQNKQQLSHQW